MKKKGLTLEEHKVVGRELKQFYISIQDIACILEARYGKRSNSARKANEIFKVLNCLRSHLDDLVCEENYPLTHPIEHDRRLEILECYYPATGVYRCYDREGIEKWFAEKGVQYESAGYS